MTAFGPSKKVLGFRPAGGSDDYSSDDDGDFDMPGLSKRKLQKYIPAASPANGQVAEGQAVQFEEDWGAPDTQDNQWQPSEHWGTTPAEEIRLACVRGNLERLRSALAKGGLNDFFSDGYTPLMTAAAHAQHHLVEYLIAEKAEVQKYNPQTKITALIAAVSNPSLRKEDDVMKCVRLLVPVVDTPDLKYLNHQDRTGLTALQCAVMKKRVEVLKFLIQNRADPDVIDQNGRTALSYAAEMGHGPLCRILLESGADVEIVDDQGWSAIELANDKGYFRLAELLHIVRTSRWKPGMSPNLIQELDEEAALRKAKSSVADGVTVKEDSQIEILLGSLNANKYIENFRKHRITYLQFLELDEEQLKDIGIEEVGIRKKLVDSIREIHNQEWQPSSIKSVAVNKKITAAEAVCMVNNIKMHLQYVSKTLLSMRNRIQKDPNCLQFGKDGNKLQHLIALCCEMKNGNGFLEKEVEDLIQYLQTIEENAEFKPGDEVAPRTIKDVKAQWDIMTDNKSFKFKVVGAGIAVMFLFVIGRKLTNAFSSR